MDELYVINLLKDTLDDKTEELEKTTNAVHFIRGKLEDAETNFNDAKWLSKDLTVLENDRRELRGQCSALRQAIAKLERED